MGQKEHKGSSLLPEGSTTVVCLGLYVLLTDEMEGLQVEPLTCVLLSVVEWVEGESWRASREAVRQ